MEYGFIEVQIKLSTDQANISDIYTRLDLAFSSPSSEDGWTVTRCCVELSSSLLVPHFEVKNTLFNLDSKEFFLTVVLIKKSITKAPFLKNLD